MAGAAIKVEGLDELRRDLRRVKDKALDDELKAIHDDLAKEVVARARPKVPVRTRKLLSTIRAGGTVRDAIGRAGKASVPYAPPIHWGYAAHGIEPRPFLRQAAEELERDIVDRYDKAVAGMLDRVIR